jgi:phosphopantothenoylcysteine synthetase/decarboxylase
MTGDLAGFGIPDFLPLATRKAMRADEIREAREARDAERERDQRAEASRSANLALYKDQAEARGEHVSALDLATGNVAGRTPADIFAAAAAMADMEDARQAAQQRRENGERLNLCFGETSRSTRPLSKDEREIENTMRRYREVHADAGIIERELVRYEARQAQRRNKPLIPARTTSGTGWPA